MRRLALLLLATALVSAACGPPGGESPAAPGDESLIGCPSGPWFPRSALDSQIDLAASGREDVDEAMRSFLDSEEGAFWPQEGWQILHEAEEAVLLVHLEPPDRLSFMTLERLDASLKWTGAQSGGSCPLVLEMPEGLNTVDWHLSPDETPRPDATRLELILQERECVSGREIGDRLVGPEVVYTEESVSISFAAEPPPGDAFECQGNPEMSYVLELEEPLGERALVSGRELGMTLEEIIR